MHECDRNALVVRLNLARYEAIEASESSVSLEGGSTGVGDFSVTVHCRLLRLVTAQ